MPSKTAKSSSSAAATSKRTSSFLLSNSPSAPGLGLLFTLFLASYPQTAGAAPGKTSHGEDLRLSKKSPSKRVLHSEPIMQRDVVKRDVVGALGRRVWPFDLGFNNVFASFFPDNPMDTGSFNANGNGNGNGQGSNGGSNPNSGGHTTPHDTQPTSTKKTSTVAAAHEQTSASQPPPQTSNNPSTTPLPQAMVTGSASGNEEMSNASGMDSETETESNGNGTGTTQQSHSSLTTGQMQPPGPNDSPYYNPGNGQTMSMGVGSNGPPSSQSGSTRGLVIGLVVSLILLLVICALAAFLFLRRLRKKRKERAASPFNEKAPWLAAAKRESSEEEGDINEKTETREGSVVSPAPSISSEPRMRARTPGGSSAIPVPYDPSEISDDVSAHFTFFPRDDSVGVPVPYPLALHIPARVAKAMAERDTRWQQYDNLQRQPSIGSGYTQDDLMTIPDRSSRRSTRRSMTDSMISSTDGNYYAPSQRLSSVHYGRHPDSQSDIALTRSDIGIPGHADHPSIHGSENGDPLTSPVSVADFPIPPPPAMARMHGSQPSNRRLRRTSAAASGGTSYSPRLLSVSENPFATNADIDQSVETDGSSSDDGTRTPLGDENVRRLSGLSAVGGVSERVTVRASPARTTVLRQSDLTINPFDDANIPGGDDRRVSSTTAITEPGSIRDSEVYAGVLETVYAFPAPPDPTRRPSIA